MLVVGAVLVRGVGGVGRAECAELNATALCDVKEEVVVVMAVEVALPGITPVSGDGP